MPRLQPRFLHRARSIHPYLPLLLRICRDLPSAQRELRWLGDHVVAITSSDRQREEFPARRQGDMAREGTLLRRFCVRRGRGEPLQYIIGDQPFGPLEILCRRGVLIPRCPLPFPLPLCSISPLPLRSILSRPYNLSTVARRHNTYLTTN